MPGLSRTRFLTIALSTVALAACGNAPAETTNLTATDNLAAPTSQIDQKKVAGSPPGSWINLTGSVVSATPTTFTLDYGQGNILVEMDDWDWYKEGRLIKAGDDVVVTGRIDDDLFQNRRVEARSVYVKNLGTFFQASGTDEEDWMPAPIVVTTVPALVEARGEVTAVEGREFTIGKPGSTIRVDTAQMTANPLDATGYQQIEVGDRVHVWGDLDLSPGEGGELMADGVTTLRQDGAAAS